MAEAERFTQRARRVLSLAHQEAQRSHHSNIGTEHLLLGLMDEDGGVAGRVLREIGLSMESVRKMVGHLTTASDNFDPAHVELSPETQQALEFAVEEARRLGHHYIGTEHILLGLVRVDSTGMEVLRELGINAEIVRRQTRRVLNESASTKDTVSWNKAPNPKKADHVFILYGQEDQKKTVAALMQILGLVPILLNVDKEGERVIEHLDKYADDAALIVIILTNVSNPDVRMDHNFIYELGYFRGKLGRNRICILYLDDFQKEAELLSNFEGVICIPMDPTGTWMTQLDKVIQEAGLKPDSRNIV